MGFAKAKYHFHLVGRSFLHNPKASGPHTSNGGPFPTLSFVQGKVRRIIKPLCALLFSNVHFAENQIAQPIWDLAQLKTLSILHETENPLQITTINR